MKQTVIKKAFAMKQCSIDVRMVLVCALMYCATAGGADWGFDANIGIDHSDNWPNAIESADRKSDAAATLRLSGIVHQQLSENTAINLSLVADSAAFSRFSGLDNLGIGPRAHLRHKFGLGPEAPWTAVSLQALHRDYDYDDRDGWQYNAGLTAGKRIGERWEISGSVQYDRYEADNLQQAVLPGISSAAYDVAGWTFGAQAAFLLTEVDTLSISAFRRHGTVTAVTPPDFEILEYSSAVARDPVFSGNPIAYRIDADADTLSVHWSRAIGRHASINLGYAYRRTQGDEDLEAYVANMINFSVSYSR
ncbi:MAG: hypothetical protein H7X76_04470 [Prolixibacteraceae bacterium]|nr:hypothetical protein [Burkholderiales bacterium]